MFGVTRRGQVVGWLCAVTIAIAGCGGSAGEPDRSSRTGDGASGSTTSPTSTPPPGTPSTTAPLDDSAAVRCTGEKGPGRDRVIALHRSRLTAAELGQGTTWAVMLHQTDRDGLCGWWEYGLWLSERDVHVLMFDLCGYGRSVCKGRDDSDQVAQATAMVKYARNHGATRVTVVGASMGGAVALPTAAASRADAVVDLSGPPDWPGTDLARDAQTLTMPTLLAVSPTDPLSVPAFRQAVKRVPASTKRLDVLPGGHGYVMLGYPGGWSRLATTVQHWIVGDYH